MFIEHLLGARYRQVELHSMDEETEAPDGETIWLRAHSCFILPH